MSSNSECPICGNSVDRRAGKKCTKCGESLHRRVYRGVLEVDVAHSGETLEEARRKISGAVDRGLRDGHRGVKIIHGHGAASGGGVIRRHAIQFLREFSKSVGGKIVQEKNNPGAHILWLN